MGNFYVNFNVRGPEPKAVATRLKGRSAFVSPVDSGCVVVFDELADAQDDSVVRKLGGKLSRALRCPVLAVLNHDDDVLRYWLFVDGTLEDEYDSAPGYFEDSGEDSAPDGGDAQLLCRTFWSAAVDDVDRILKAGAFDDDGQVFAVKRHSELMAALGLSRFGVGYGYGQIAAGDLPEGMKASELIRLEASVPAPQGPPAVLPGYYKRIAFGPDGACGHPVGWMPGTWASSECAESDLSDACRGAIKDARDQILRLGFREVGFRRSTGVLDPKCRGSGGVAFLDADRRQFMLLIWVRMSPGDGRADFEALTMVVTAQIAGCGFSCTNQINAVLGDPPNTTVLR
jgi:hypothetical protein